MPYLISVIVSIASSFFATKAANIALSRGLIAASFAFWLSATVILLGVYNSFFSSGGTFASVFNTLHLPPLVLDGLALIPHEMIDMTLCMLSLRAAAVFYITVVRVNIRMLTSNV